MAALGESLRDAIERRTGIVGQVLRERREKQEENQQIERQIARVEQTTQAIRMTGATLTHIEVLFTQISKNFQAINKSFGVLVALQEDENKSLKAEEATTQVIAQQKISIGKIQPISMDDDGFSLLDLFNPLDLLDDFDRKKKSGDARRKKIEEERKKRQAERDRAKAEQKEVDKNKEKTRAKAESEAKAARDKALKEGKSVKDAERAAANAAKKVVKKANADAVKKVARKYILAKIGRAVVKSIPIIGTVASVAFLVDAIWEAISEKNYTKVGAEAVGLIPIVGGPVGAVESAAAETYKELYGTDYLTDKANGVEGADQAYFEVHKIVAEEFEKAVKEALFPAADQIYVNWKAKARARKTDPKILSKEEARNALDSGLSDKELDNQFEGGRKALEQRAGAKPTQKTTAPTPAAVVPTTVTVVQPTSAPVQRANTSALAAYERVKTIAQTTSVAAPAPSARQATEEQIREIAKQKAAAYTESGKFNNQKDFIDALFPYAQKVAELIGGKVPPLAILGQWAGESGSGTSLPADFNYAGIKAAGTSFAKGDYVLTEEFYTDDQLKRAKKSGESFERVVNLGDKIKKKGKEVDAWDFYAGPGKGAALYDQKKSKGQQMVQIKTYFAKFKNFEDFATGFAKFISTPKYAKARAQTTPEGFGFEVAAAGYATAAAEKYSAKVANFASSQGAYINQMSTQVAGVKTDNKIDQAKNLNVIAINETNRRSVPA